MFKNIYFIQIDITVVLYSLYQLNTPIVFHVFLIGATDYTGLRTPIFHQQLCWVLMQLLFITVAYYIGDSENIEQMQNELCILLLDTEHSEIRGYGLYKKGYNFQTNIINKYTCYTNKSSYFYDCA